MKTIKTIIVLLAAALLAWALPWCYAFVCSEPQESPLTLYSCVTHDFATFSFEGHDDAAGYDPAGNPYTERQFDSIMPTVFTRRLAEEGRLPERIDGIPFDAREVELSNFVFRASPSELNRPQIGLYQLLESAPGREGFRTPDDVFRITERGIEFVKMADNRIDAEKSERFDRVMKKKGFVFPARRIAGNASTYKHYDNGYLLLDATGTPFQMKQFCGRPFVRRIERPDSVTFTYAFVTEFPDKRLLGFLGDDRGGIHALEADYSLHCLPLHPVDLRRERLIVVGDCFIGRRSPNDRASNASRPSMPATIPLLRSTRPISPLRNGNRPENTFSRFGWSSPRRPTNTSSRGYATSRTWPSD